MKAVLTKEEYKEFTESVDLLKRKHDINIPHTVETKEDKFLITLLEDIDVEHLDNLLENTWQQNRMLIQFMDGEQTSNRTSPLSPCISRFGSNHNSESSWLITLFLLT